MIRNDLLKNEQADLSIRITSMINLSNNSDTVIQNDKKHSNKQIRSKSNYSSCGSGSTRHITTNAYYNNTSSFKSK